MNTSHSADLPLPPNDKHEARARALCESRRGVGAFERPYCKRKHWRDLTRDIAPITDEIKPYQSPWPTLADPGVVEFMFEALRADITRQFSQLRRKTNQSLAPSFFPGYERQNWFAEFKAAVPLYDSLVAAYQARLDEYKRAVPESLFELRMAREREKNEARAAALRKLAKTPLRRTLFDWKA